MTPATIRGPRVTMRGDWGTAAYRTTTAAMRRVELDDWIALDDESREGAVLITGVDTPPAERRQGSARALFNALTQWADANGERLMLVPASSGEMGNEDLISWYGRHGFELESDGVMLRDPT